MLASRALANRDVASRALAGQRSRDGQRHPPPLVDAALTSLSGPCNPSNGRPDWAAEDARWPPSWCEGVEALLEPHKRMSMREQMRRHKYMIVVDGWASADRLLAVLGSGCVPMIVGPYHPGRLPNVAPP